MGEVAVLSIGTTHPWNIAGVGLDLRIGAQLGVRVFTVLAAISAQDGTGVRALELLSPATVQAQLEVLPWPLVTAVRVGALGSPEAVHAVAAALASRDLPVVVDPVVFATGGGALAAEGTLPAIEAELLTLPQVVLTPNLDEAGALLERKIDRAHLAEAAVALRSRGARAVLLKGGHLAGEPSDVLADRDGVETFSGQRINAEMRGTGCTLAMALAVALGRGDELRDAVRFARGFVREKLVLNAG